MDGEELRGGEDKNKGGRNKTSAGGTLVIGG